MDGLEARRLSGRGAERRVEDACVRGEGCVCTLGQLLMAEGTPS